MSEQKYDEQRNTLLALDVVGHVTKLMQQAIAKQQHFTVEFQAGMVEGTKQQDGSFKVLIDIKPPLAPPSKILIPTVGLA